MFLNMNILKKLMKQAYKSGGLYVGQTEDRYYIAGLYWEMDIVKGMIPKQIVAQIFELIGEMPELGTTFRATKDELEIEHNGREVETREYDVETEVTDFILIHADGTEQRVVRDKKYQKLHVVNDVFIVIADNSEIDKGAGETPVEDTPLCDPAYGILWENNAARFRAYWRVDDGHRRTLDEMKPVNLEADLLCPV